MTNANQLLAPAFLLMLALASPAFGQDKKAPVQAATEEAKEAPERVEEAPDRVEDEPTVIEVAPFVLDETTVRLATRKRKARSKVVPLQVIQCDAELGCRMVDISPKAAKRGGGRK